MKPGIRTRILERDGWRCQLCGIDTPKELRGTYKPNAPEVDHVIPKARGGGWDEANLRCVCHVCNLMHGKLLDTEMIEKAKLWLVRLEGTPQIPAPPTSPAKKKRFAIWIRCGYSNRTMTLQEFSQRYGCARPKRDSSGDEVIPGWQEANDMPSRPDYGHHIYDNGNGMFGVCLMFLNRLSWTTVKRKLEAAGFTVRQDGDTEGTALFNPTDGRQARLALSLAMVAQPAGFGPLFTEAA